MRKRIHTYFLYILVLYMVIFSLSMFRSVFGFGDGFTPGVVPDVERVTGLDDPVYKVWSTISLILKILAIAGVIITGIRYMFSTFDTKSKIKESLPTLIIGIVIVFAATLVIDFVITVTSQALDV